MRLSIFFLLFSLYDAVCVAQNQNQLAILNQFIEAHNAGGVMEIENFILQSYGPNIYKQIDLPSHVNFYQHIINEFGNLNPSIYGVVEAHPLKLIVHLIKEGESLLNDNIDPGDILVVEIDLEKESPDYLSRGLGLGALACELREERR